MALRARVAGGDHHNSSLLGPASLSDQAGMGHSLLLAQRHLGWVERALELTGEDGEDSVSLPGGEGAQALLSDTVTAIHGQRR